MKYTDKQLFWVLFYDKLKKITQKEVYMSMNKQIMQIAARIREMREILDIDPAELAKELGISTEEYLQYETGEDDIPIGVL